MVPPPAPAGSQGPYEPLEKVGSGGMGSVWRARHRETGRIVALKRLLGGYEASEAARTRFAREAAAMRTFDHPGLVRLVDSDLAAPEPWVALDFVEGVTLDEWADEVDLTPRRAVQMVRRIAEALAHAHACGIVHRDLKPTNVLVDRNGVPHVTDFGLARAVEAEGTGLTREGEILGTPGYMSPEQAEGRLDRLDARSDLFSLGSVLFRLLAGRGPFDGGNPSAVVFRVVYEPAPDVRSLASTVDRGLAAVCRKLLEKDPADRYARAEELVRDFDLWLDGKAPLARAPGPLRRLARTLGGRPRRKLFAGAAVAGALVLAAAVALRGPAAPAPRPPPSPAEAEPVARARVASVVDADTIEAEFLGGPDARDGPGGRRLVRLLGIDAPEKRNPHKPEQPFGEEAARFARELLTGREVEIVGDPSRRDRYGRVLAYVHRDGEDVGARLVRAGWARVFLPEEFSRREGYLALEREAREARRGMWSGSAPRPAAPGPFVGNRESRVLHAPGCRRLPGRDNRVEFATREEAEAAGYKPHAECLGPR
ncbi:MAG: protein kinase [Planctomycetales bacterium]|nr:protein kinase [Planctomycetales bacterium]